MRMMVMTDSDDEMLDPLLGEGVSYSSYLRSSKKSFTDESLHAGEEDIRLKLQWFFKNPYEKYKERGRKPWKLVLQVVKIILVTVQATWFATDEFSSVQFNTDNIETFRQVFLQGYSQGLSQNLITKQMVHEHIFNVWMQYYNFETVVVGMYEIPHFDNGSLIRIAYCEQINERAQKYLIHNSTDSVSSDCRELLPPRGPVNETTLSQFVADNRIPDKLAWVEMITLEFWFQSIRNLERYTSNTPDCYTFVVTVNYDNQDLDSIVVAYLESDVTFKYCRDLDVIGVEEPATTKIFMTVFDCVIIVVCTVSLALCIRSIRRHVRLGKETAAFFKEYRYEKFTISDSLNFISFWIVLIMLSDVCTFVGSCIKIVLDWTEAPNLYDLCSLGFGLAVLFSWTGVLRYLGFMKGFNTLLVTLKTAFPTVLRFVICAAFIYMGFLFCGWIVFGPYNEKFSNLYFTSETMFSLVNGDDMYNTFYLMDDSSSIVWYFSKVYLYIFVSLFIFVILSLFIGIVCDTYERIKDFGYAPKTRVELFMEGTEHNVNPTAQQSNQSTAQCPHGSYQNIAQNFTSAYS